MLKSSLCDYSNMYKPLNGKITSIAVGDYVAAREEDARGKKLIFKQCAPFTECISKINNAHIDNIKDQVVVMTVFNLREYSSNYSKKSARLWQYNKFEPRNTIANSKLFKDKIKFTGKTRDDGSTENVEIAVLVKYLSNFWRTLITNSTGAGTLAMTDTALYVLVVAFIFKDNAKTFKTIFSVHNDNWQLLFLE